MSDKISEKATYFRNKDNLNEYESKNNIQNYTSKICRT